MRIFLFGFTVHLEISVKGGTISGFISTDYSSEKMKLVMMMNCSQAKTPISMTSMQMSYQEMVLAVCSEILWLCKTTWCSSWLGGWFQTILEVKRLDVEVQDWCDYMWSAVVRLVVCTLQFS